MTPPPLVQLTGLDGLTRFDHEAMATSFTLHLAASPQGELRPIAEEAFRLLDRIEDRLSFYREGSDVTRLNRANPGDTIRIDELTHRCLLHALEVSAASNGAFDPFAGAASLSAKKQPVPHHLADLLPPEPDDARPVLAINPDAPIVTKLAGQRWLDLGAVGKGAALDALAELLVEWEVPTAVLVGGGSSVLVYGPNPETGTAEWALILPQFPQQPSVHLAAPFALGASGEGFQPGHIINRRATTTAARPQALIVAPSAALADALSTAALLMSDIQLQTLLGPEPTCSLLATHATAAAVTTGAFTTLPSTAPLATVVIPCWCESARLPPFLTALAAAVSAANLRVEILVIDDGSPDPEPLATSAAVDAVRLVHPFVRPLQSVESHQGKGGAVYWGWRHAAPTSQWLAFVDADGAVPPDEVVRGLQLALAADAPPRQLIAATRYHRDPTRHVHRGPIRQRSGGWFARWAQRQLRLGATDSQCGFKIIPATWWRERTAPWRELGYAFDLELLIAARDDGLPVDNLPIVWREVGGSNVTWRDGWQLVQTVKRLR